MARKNLNLSIDRGLLQPSDDDDRIPSGPDTPVELVYSKQKKRATRQTRERVAGRPWAAVITGVIAVANMLFLLLAGIWLSGHTSESPTLARTATARVTPDPGLILVQINNRLDSIDQRLGGLDLAMDKQQAIIDSDSFDIDSQLREALGQQKNTADAPAPSTPSTPSPPPTAWHINLGNFDSRGAALDLQQRLQAIGHKARIKTTASAGKNSFLVVLPGFSQREPAELVAKQIMEQTDLDSLWVGEGE